MKNSTISRGLFWLVFVLCSFWTDPAVGQTTGGQTNCHKNLIISSFNRSGQLVCVNLKPGTKAAVEFSRSPVGPWANNPALNDKLVGSDGTLKVSVPVLYPALFFRVRGVAQAEPCPLPPYVEPTFGQTASGLVWTNSNGAITITKYVVSDRAAVDIPGLINGLPVTSIGDYAFYFSYGLTNVTIPDSITSIGDGAFAECHSLVNVTIPDSVVSLGRFTFNKCSNLTGAVIGNGVTNIGRSTFASTSLASITIPDSVVSLGNFAFAYCSRLTSITIPDSVTVIGDRVFPRCSSLASVIIGKSVNSIGAAVFANCPSLTSVYFRGNVPRSTADDIFYLRDLVTVYYLAGSTGWGPTFFGRPTALWEEQIDIAWP